MLAARFAVLAVLLALGSYIAGAHLGRDWPVFIATGLLAVLAFSYSCKIDVDLQRLSNQPAPAEPPPRERTHRQELELAMAHGMGALVANPDYKGKSVGTNVREALDAMLAQSAPASLAELRWGMNAYPGRADQHKCLVHSVAACPCQKASDDLMRSAGYEGEQAPASSGPRVTPADVEAEIAREHYFTAEQGAKHPDAVAEPYDFGDVWKSSNLGALTFCVLVLKNGTKVVGMNYGAIDPAQHSAERGREEARAQAVEKVWELLGFRLRDKLAGGS
ncbi:hypothetical protein BFJ72_g14603 [Fusarium proliferatum]|uniref:Uncharacterized protein n=1 Tax=Gibberella intermedia TaxID=948311 RepID=A0A420S0K4_GIBIN|nr:hypothetical protein BFJ72_g14603 [Fusarium proliferatum]